jgi:hypothetical protein
MNRFEESWKYLSLALKTKERISKDSLEVAVTLS